MSSNAKDFSGRALPLPPKGQAISVDVPAELRVALSLFQEVRDVLKKTPSGDYAYDGDLVLEVSADYTPKLAPRAGDLIDFEWSSVWHQTHIMLDGEEKFLCRKEHPLFPEFENSVARMMYVPAEVYGNIIDTGSYIHMEPMTAYSAGFFYDGSEWPLDFHKRLCIKVSNGLKFAQDAGKISRLRATLSR
jgi:hypothetical protein